MSKSSFENAPKYLAWKKNVLAAGCRIDEVQALTELDKPDGSLLFAFLKTKIYDPEGRPLLSYALIRGAAVIIVPVIENSKTGVCKFLMVQQRRIGHGQRSLEFPAGMVDLDLSSPRKVAQREMEEETGIKISESDLIPLCDKPLYTSPGLDDESIHYFTCHLKMDPEAFAELEMDSGLGSDGSLAPSLSQGSDQIANQKIFGHPDEHEFITTGLWTEADALPLITSLQVRLGFFLYQNYAAK